MSTRTVLVLATVILVAAAVAGLAVFMPQRTPRGEPAAQLPPTAVATATNQAPPVTASPPTAPVAVEAAAATEGSTPSVSPAPANQASARRVVATYFHNTARCATCRLIEQRARETMESAFAEDIASGRLVWRALNMELREYEHYATDYDLTSPSLVLALMDGDGEVRFAVLKDTWTLVRNKVQFETYVIAETRAFLEEL